MKNNSGFTLIETIAVIIILGIVLTIAVPTITNVVKRTNEKRMIEDAELFISIVKEKVESDTMGDIKEKYYLNDINSSTIKESPFGGEYNSGASYVKVNDSDYTVCLTDGTYNASGTNSSIKVEKGGCANE